MGSPNTLAPLPPNGVNSTMSRGGSLPDYESSSNHFEEIIREEPIPIGRPRLDLSRYPKENLRIPDESSGDNEPEEEYEEEEDGRIQTKHAVPDWFPKKIKKIFRVDRHGGQLTFRELDCITRYRTAMERVKRIKWKTYLKAGRMRWQLQRYLRRKHLTHPKFPSIPSLKLRTYRKKQFAAWDEKALKGWKRLERLQLGLRVLDEAIHLNFRQERMIYEKKLGALLN